jgi:Amt family ammonium transporter
LTIKKLKRYLILAGWASPLADKDERLFGVGAIDFAGSTVVHMVGGLMALIGTIFLGPRSGRFIDGKAQEMVFQSSTLQTLGTLLLWFGW